MSPGGTGFHDLAQRVCGTEVPQPAVEIGVLQPWQGGSRRVTRQPTEIPWHATESKRLVLVAEWLSPQAARGRASTEHLSLRAIEKLRALKWLSSRSMHDKHGRQHDVGAGTCLAMCAATDSAAKHVRPLHE